MKTKSIRNIFAQSARSAILVFELVFLGSVILSSCQIEKRQHMKGFFIGNPAESHNIRCLRNQTTDSISTQEKTASFSEIVEPGNADTISASQLIDPVPERYISKEKSFDKCTKNFDFEYLKLFNNPCGRKASLQPVISLSNKNRKIHPFAIWAFLVVLIDFLQLILAVYLNSGIFFMYLFFALLLIACIFIQVARLKTKRNPEKWNGLILENILFVLLAVVVLSGLLSIVILTL